MNIPSKIQGETSKKHSSEENCTPQSAADSTRLMRFNQRKLSARQAATNSASSKEVFVPLNSMEI